MLPESNEPAAFSIHVQEEGEGLKDRQTLFKYIPGFSQNRWIRGGSVVNVRGSYPDVQGEVSGPRGYPCR
jgi:hypothetical protein